MAVTEELRVEIRAEASKAIREMREFQSSTKKASGSANKLGKVLKRGLGAAAAAVSIGALVSTMKSSVAAFQKQEEASRALSAAVARNPLLDGSVAGRLESFASELQSVTTVGDETAIQLASLAASSGRTEAEIKKMVRAAADVSAAMGITMDSAMRSLNKSFGGMTGELGELVPELQNLTKEQLKAGEGVDLIRQQFDGAAQAMADTASGGLKQMNSALSDLSEAIGKRILTNMSGLIDRVKGVAEAITDVISESNRLSDMRSGNAGQVSEEDYQKALAITEDIETRIAEKEEQRNRIVEQRRAYIQAGQRTQADLLSIQEAQLNNQLRMIENEKENVKWAYDVVEAYEAADESTGNVADNTEEAADAAEEAAKNWRIISGEADNVAKARFGATLIKPGDTTGQIRELYKENRAIQENFYQTERQRIEQQKQDYIDAGVDRVDAEAWAQKQIRQLNLKTAQVVMGAFSTVYGQLSGIVSAYATLERQELERTMAKYDERMEQLTEQHERQLEFAEASGATEKELQELKEQQAAEEEALEEEKERKRKDAEREAFQRQKAMRIANATMAGAQATIGALAGPDVVPFPVKLGFAATVAAMTAAQVGIISQQQFPGLASGGIVPAQGEGGGLYRLGDKNKAETVLPFDIRQGGGMGNITVNISGVIGDRERVAEWVNEGIRRGRERGKIRRAS